MKQKIVITGSNGLLGQSLVKLLLKSSDDVEIFALSRGENRLRNKRGYQYHEIDLTDQTALNRIIDKIQPDVIVHTAALTNVDACEIRKDECYTINVEVVEYLVALCRQYSTHFIHLSTDFIFDGQKGALYNEEDKPNPLSYYGWSKLESEKVVIKANIKYTILRTILVYGLVDDNDRSNIVLWVKNSIENQKNIHVVTDQFRMPTFVDDLALACKLSIEKETFGIYHISSNELLSIFEITQQVAQIFQLDKKYIHPITTKALNLTAERPFKTGFDLKKSISQLTFPSLSFRDGLQRFKIQLDRFSSSNET